MKESKFEISKIYTIRWINIGIRKSEFVTKTQFIFQSMLNIFRGSVASQIWYSFIGIHLTVQNCKKRRDDEEEGWSKEERIRRKDGVKQRR